MESRFDISLKGVYKILNVIGGTALTVMMLLTVTDVTMSSIGHPILGAYELVPMIIVVVIGFIIPKVLIIFPCQIRNMSLKFIRVETGLFRQRSGGLAQLEINFNKEV